MSLVLSACFLMTAPGLSSAGAAYEIKPASGPVPGDVPVAIRDLLAPAGWRLVDSKGAGICELWLRKQIAAKATPEQVKNGLTYRELEESTLLGVIRYEQQATDYRKQKIKPGLYTIRIGFQPQDGDHMGTAPHAEFCLLAPLASDLKPSLMEAKELRELSRKATGGSHPCVLLLYPNEKPDSATKLLDKGNDTWALAFKQAVEVDGNLTDDGIGFALTLVGHTTAE